MGSDVLEAGPRARMGSAGPVGEALCSQGPVFAWPPERGQEGIPMLVPPFQASGKQTWPVTGPVKGQLLSSSSTCHLAFVPCLCDGGFTLHVALACGSVSGMRVPVLSGL